MSARRELDEMNTYLRQVEEYVSGSDFDAERHQAQEEFFGQTPPEFDDEQELLDQYGSYVGWFMFDRPHSRTAATPVRMYVDRHEELPAGIRENLLRCEASVYSTFRVAEVGPGWAVMLDLLGDEGDYYRVTCRAEDRLQRGDLVCARVVRWSDSYQFHGPLEPWPNTPALRSRPAPLRERRGSEAVRAPVERAGGEAYLGSRRAWLRERRQRP